MNGITLEVKHCQDPAIYPLVASEMANMHWNFEPHHMMSNGSDDDTGDHLENNNHKNSLYLQNNQQISNLYPKSQIWNKLRQFNNLAEEIMAADPDFKDRLVSQFFI